MHCRTGADHDGHDVLARPGQADVTALVDFAMLAKSARQAGAQTAGPLEQGSFLRALGIAARAEALKSNPGPAPAARCRGPPTATGRSATRTRTTNSGSNPTLETGFRRRRAGLPIITDGRHSASTDP